MSRRSTIIITMTMAMDIITAMATIIITITVKGADLRRDRVL